MRIDDEFSTKQWTSVLRLLAMWRFTAGQAAVLKKLLVTADPVTKVALCSEHPTLCDYTTWLRPAAFALAERRDPIEHDEAHIMGIENTVKIAAIREQYIRANGRDWRQRDEVVDNCIALHYRPKLDLLG